MPKQSKNVRVTSTNSLMKKSSKRVPISVSVLPEFIPLRNKKKAKLSFHNRSKMKVFSGKEWFARSFPSSSEPGDDEQDPQTCLRLFVSGDRSQVGKSSCCLGILASLVDRLGYSVDQVAYIKPATQCEAPQLVTRYCEKRGIEWAAPAVVYFSGFTREYLLGNTSSSAEMEDQVRRAVDNLCAKKGRKIVVVDGVGYPSVGSIVGLSNAVLARASRAPVVLICPKGVGNAVDSYNINATYFEHHGVHVLGSIYNRFPLDGFYSLDNCKESIDSYFQQYQSDKMPYGYLPELGSLIGASPPPVAPSSNDRKPEITNGTSEGWMKADDERVASLVQAFEKYANLDQLLKDLKTYQAMGSPTKQESGKRQSISEDLGIFKKRKVLSRDEIVAKATASGASGGG